MPAKIPRARRRCQPAAAMIRRAYEAAPDRRADKAFYSSAAWRALRAAYLAEWPLCRRCPPARPTPALEVHHRKPRDAYPDLALDYANLEGLCRTCHRKTRAEDSASRSAAPGSSPT